ncbi:amidohydrolase family protein (plasmid) [Lichenicola cladoniae]|uniref:Amidohydrolase family protein n=1 Tax=Lichenicola cladoniae TaxID=1484109 RepID=A0A6M8HXX1_9PROT|nr:amidohydrolase family protein [Lichenicola cladoniae]NPD68655.1 amidohydrolase family protein [Acetobacteraceae bacterium]QKE93037.1 amidohydrolase family protein [Lichenicola cladoniae]
MPYDHLIRLETLLPAFFTGAVAQGLDAAAPCAAQLSERPAKFFGLWPQKGAIQVGADADLAVLTPGVFRWDSAQAHDALNWSPYDGRQFSARVRRTYLGGQLAWDGADIQAHAGQGRYVRRGTSAWFR